MRLSGRKASSHTPRWSPPQRVVLLSLIGVNLFVFISQLVVQAYEPGLVAEFLGLSYRGIDRAFAWQFLSAAFLHPGVLGFALNLTVLYLVGRDLESILGEKHFCYLYFSGIVGGELSHLFLMPADTVLLAASGGIAAVIVTYATILPELGVADTLFFFFPFKLKAKYLGYALLVCGLVLTLWLRTGVISHSAYLGGAVAGWLYAHLLGYGRPSLMQRALRRRRRERERRERMPLEEFIAEEIDPLLEKISRSGLSSLSRRERRILARVREKMVQSPP
jgi:membrane associated rhomboid family serine protease